MKKRNSLLITLLFCVFLGMMGLAGLLQPDRSFSEAENRNLRLLPEFTVKRVLSGRFMQEAEDYVADQTAFRDFWVSVMATAEKLSGKQENNGIYFCKKDTLIPRVEAPEEAALADHVKHLNALVEEADIPVYFGLIPSAAAIWSDKLPQGAPTADEERWIQWIYDQSAAQNIDIWTPLQAHSHRQLYYRTDHHWTSLGAYYGANGIFEQMGCEPLELDAYHRQVVSEDFYGTSHSAAAAWWIEPDTVEIYVSEEGKTVTSNFTGRDEPGRLYVPQKLDTKNQYTYFLGGNQPLCVIESEVQGPKLLVIRDSYADALAPFLAERFSQIHLFDLRYNRLPVKDYIEANGIDAVLVLYSFCNYIADENQFLLSRT